MSTSHQTNDCNKFQAMLYFGKVSRTEERELKKHLSSHLGTGFCPTRQSVNMLSEGHSVVHYGSCEFTFEGNNKAEFVERHCYSGGGKADSTDDECHRQRELTCGEEM